MPETQEIATFAGGCFWCTEAIFKRVEGVTVVMPGYAGQGKENPSYEEVSAGDSGYTEALQLTFDPSVVSYETLLEIFFKTHDPTSFDRQGADAGPQYRSIVFYHSDAQKEAIDQMIMKLNEAQVFASKILTEVKPLKQFYEAERYHRDFYDKNRDYPYCTVVINPKLEKLYKEFANKVKKDPSLKVTGVHL